MRRRLFNVLAAVSLVLCVGTAVLWARSYTRAYGLRFTGQPDSAIEAVHGGIEAWHGRVRYSGPRAWQRSSNPLAVHVLRFAAAEHPRMGSNWDRSYREYLGFGFGGGAGYVWLARVPLWFPTLALAITTLGCVRFGRRRHGRGHCQRCGYDLTGNVSGICPECGTSTSPHSAANGALA